MSFYFSSFEKRDLDLYSFYPIYPTDSSLKKYQFFVVNQMYLLFVLFFFSIPASVLKLFMSPQEGACHFRHCCGEIFIVVQVANFEDRTV